MFMFMFPLAAMAAPVFPAEINGFYTVTLKTDPQTLDVDGIPLEEFTRSVELVADLTRVLCQAMGNDEEVPVIYPLADNQTGRVKVEAFAHSNVDCTGLVSTASNPAFHFFKGPKKPNILLQTTP
jgi:hypothetical protein